ncbi:TetR/AcrR family transcriptional regulator [Calothrix rhizosoleniae]|uniref:TetR/AcrR family transcriptional regulator n=1 Tax=Calothrix rhizosoleniae TaxID=888997 RepID=UPI000B49C75F|nr:TetR/AcrR family transcriptional regulator [Calothrix rhizosoleniae]
MTTNDTRTQILDTAQQLIQKVGLNAMSYADISNAVGIRKASIHYHFPTKDDLVAALLERYSPYFLRLFDVILESPESPEMKLRRYCGLFEATMNSGQQDQACLCGMLGAELKTLNSPLSSQVVQFYRDNHTRLAQLLQQGRETGEFQFPGSLESMAMLIFSMLEGGMLITRADGGVAQFREMVEQLIQVVKG